MTARRLTALIPRSVKRRIPALRERDALRHEVHALRGRVAELEERLDHERLFPLEWANRRVRDRYGDEVVAGPFAGMRYPDWGFVRVDLFAPKLLGIFERELHPAVERLIARSPRLIVNVGAAEGYYAVGLARRLPDARVAAFEMDPERAEQLEAIAELNGVADRIETRAVSCNHEHLASRLDERSGLVCDCDGCEADLLDPGRVPALRRISLLVEVHDRLAPGTGDRLREAFGPTHEISALPAEPRRIADFPDLEFLPWATRQLAIAEFRGGPASWFELVPRT